MLSVNCLVRVGKWAVDTCVQMHRQLLYVLAGPQSLQDGNAKLGNAVLLWSDVDGHAVYLSHALAVRHLGVTAEYVRIGR